MQKLLKYSHGPTHNKLIVGIHRSFPHRSGIVKTLHVVGLVEAASGVRRGKHRLKLKKRGKIGKCDIIRKACSL